MIFWPAQRPKNEVLRGFRVLHSLLGITVRLLGNSTLLFLIRKLRLGLKSSKTGSWTGTTSTKLIFQSNVWRVKLNYLETKGPAAKFV